MLDQYILILVLQKPTTYLLQGLDFLVFLIMASPFFRLLSCYDLQQQLKISGTSGL